MRNAVISNLVESKAIFSHLKNNIIETGYTQTLVNYIYKDSTEDEMAEVASSYTSTVFSEQICVLKDLSHFIYYH